MFFFIFLSLNPKTLQNQKYLKKYMLNKTKKWKSKTSMRVFILNKNVQTVNRAFNLPMPSLINIEIHCAFTVKCGFVPLVSQVYLGLPERVYPGIQTKVTVGGVPLAAPVGKPSGIDGCLTHVITESRQILLR